MNVRELFRAAADYMDTHGKAKGAWSLPDGQVCTFGAMARVTGIDGHLQGEVIFANPVIKAAIPILNAKILGLEIVDSAATSVTSESSIINWSDTTDEATVIATLRDLSKEDE